MIRIAIVGATGAVGRQMLTCLKEQGIEADIKLLASSRSVGKMIDGYVVEECNEESFVGVDYALGATESDVTKRWVPWGKANGCVVIDNSNTYRMDPSVPLVVPEINALDAKNHNGVIANPNCATIIALVALNALHQAYHIKSMTVSTYQAVSGAGVQGIEDLQAQSADPSIPSKAFPYQIAYNLIPQIGNFDVDGITSEEAKMQNEGRKIWHHPELLVNCTCVRVPIMRSHSESITVEFDKAFDLDEVRSLLSVADGVKLVDDPAQQDYPMPIHTTDKDIVEVGRLRYDPTDPSHHRLSLFCCGDQIRKGAATNAVQILKSLL